MAHNIIDQLLVLAVDIDRLKPMEGNPRKGDVASVKASLAEFGQRKPVVAMADGTITAGHHLFYAASELGWDQVAAVFVSEDPVRGKAFGLADNRTSELGTMDLDALALMAEEVWHEDAALLAAASYSEDDLEKLLNPPGPKVAPEPSPVISYNLIFDDDRQQETFFAFIRWLKRTKRGDTVAARFTDFLNELELEL